jgi:hypothetical protein
MRLLASLFLFIAALPAQDYQGPVPPKPDIPYLLHASNLVETEVKEAHQEPKKNETLYWVEGASSPARTPLAEPIFILRAEKLRPEKIEMYRFESKKDRRELILKDKPKKGDAAPLHLSVTKVGKDLWKIEASEVLPNGEYSLSPSGSNDVFCFQVY